MPRALKEPEGWRDSSLRRILLLRFRNLVVMIGEECWGLSCRDVAPLCSFPENGTKQGIEASSG